jgi:methyltransferase (TIGR00027 family)
MSFNYKDLILNLKKSLPFINSVAILDGKNIYSIDNVEDRENFRKIGIIWSSMRRESFDINEMKYLVRVNINNRFIASSSIGEGHIVGVKEGKKMMIAIIEPDGIIPFTTVEMLKVLTTLKQRKSNFNENLKLNQKANYNGLRSLKRNKVIGGEIKHDETDIPFTARLMAYYRAQESRKETPLISDPFADILAGDLSDYLSRHIRVSKMDYPIVRSYFIEEKLLKYWCDSKKYSQIVLLGAGLDTRAYRFRPLQQNNHIVFEIDLFPIIKYKEDKLRHIEPLCRVKRLPVDLSDSDLSQNLVKGGFSNKIPTFWILEGIAYYIEQESVKTILKQAAEISTADSQIFVDLMHIPRWFPFYINDMSSGPFTRHIKWAINIKNIPTFFKANGWKVSYSWADNHDQGRDVGQKAMIFVHGIKD